MTILGFCPPCPRRSPSRPSYPRMLVISGMMLAAGCGSTPASSPPSNVMVPAVTPAGSPSGTEKEIATDPNPPPVQPDEPEPALDGDIAPAFEKGP